MASEMDGAQIKRKLDALEKCVRIGARGHIKRRRFDRLAVVNDGASARCSGDRRCSAASAARGSARSDSRGRKSIALSFVFLILRFSGSRYGPVTTVAG